MVEYINKGKNLTKKSIDLGIRDEFIAYCDELPFGILSYSSYLDLKKMKIVPSVIFDDEYKLLGTKSKKMVAALKILKMLLIIGFLKTLRDNNKTHSNDIILEEELLKYMRLNKKDIEYIRIKEFIKRLKELRELFDQENMIEENKKQLVKEIHELEMKKCKKLDGLECHLNFERISRKIHDRDTCFCDEIKEKAKEEIDKIEELMRKK